MKKLYEVKFNVKTTVEAWAEEQIKDELVFSIAKAISDTFGFSPQRTQMDIEKIQEVEYPDVPEDV